MTCHLQHLCRVVAWLDIETNEDVERILEGNSSSRGAVSRGKLRCWCCFTGLVRYFRCYCYHCCALPMLNFCSFTPRGCRGNRIGSVFCLLCVLCWPHSGCFISSSVPWHVRWSVCFVCCPICSSYQVWLPVICNTQLVYSQITWVGTWYVCHLATACIDTSSLLFWNVIIGFLLCRIDLYLLFSGLILFEIFGMLNIAFLHCKIDLYLLCSESILFRTYDVGFLYLLSVFWHFPYSESVFWYVVHLCIKEPTYNNISGQHATVERNHG